MLPQTSQFYLESANETRKAASQSYAIIRGAFDLRSKAEGDCGAGDWRRK